MTHPRVNLYETQHSGVNEIMDGSWKKIEVKVLRPHERLDLVAEGDEHCVFTIDGSALVQEPDGRQWSFAPGSTVTLPHGGRCSITAGDEGFRYLIISLYVPNA
jgi:hypothetical protein